MIDSRRLGLTLFVSESESNKYRKNNEWKKCAISDKTHSIKGQKYTLVEKWERDLPFFSSERITRLAFGLFCCLFTCGFGYLSTTVQRCLTGRQVMCIVKPVLEHSPAPFIEQ